MMRLTTFIISLGGLLLTQGQTILHYRVSDTDADEVSSGVVPGVDGSADGQVAFGQVTLSEDVPTDGVPGGAGNRSLAFDGASGINLPGTQQLLNADIDAAGGFTYEAWFNYGGGGQVNSIIDYAGTEKLVRNVGGDQTGYLNNSAAPQYLLGTAGENEWHYVAVVFTPTAPEEAGSITGNFAFYFDGIEPIEPSEPALEVTISDFGDSLNRTIAVGAHPLGFGGDFITGLIYEPRVTLGALDPDELLYQGFGGAGLMITNLEHVDGGNDLTWNSKPDATYTLEYSLDLESWTEIEDTITADSETKTFEFRFSPGFESLATEPGIFYRVSEDD